MSKKYKIAIAWIRRDLRLSDHTALSHATHSAESVVVVFCFDKKILSPLPSNDRRLSFIHSSLEEVDIQLRKLGSKLVVLHGDPEEEIPKLAKSLCAQAVFTNRDYEPKAITRDKNVEKNLKKISCEFYTFKDQVIFETTEILTNSNTPFKVFTPYKNAWLKALKTEHHQEYKVGENFLKKEFLNFGLKNWDLEKIGFKKQNLWLPAGTSGARELWKKFSTNIEDYQEARNFPAKQNCTSTLSTHLRFGTISIRSLVRFALKKHDTGSTTWLSELIWRDFYHMILANFPHVENSAFKNEYSKIHWPGPEAHFNAWCEGETGYPIVDAAMKHFNSTGWMHNRLRMIVAMFLTKDLLIDWRKGEEYFATHLLDFDLAANNGGWQWSASTGCDAQPYFRIFNPVSQSEKFDPKGEYILEHLPELKKIPLKDIHWPHELGLLRGKYPEPIVDHSIQRTKALTLFKKD